MKRIPVYQLYGDKHENAGPDLVHIEKIYARSAINQWNIKPHRHSDLVQFLIVERGGGRVEVGELSSILGEGHCVFIPPKITHSFDFKPGTDGYVVTIKSHILTSLVDEFENYKQIYREGIYPLMDQTGDFREIIHLVQQLEQECRLFDLRKQSLCVAYSRLLLSVLFRAFENYHESTQSRSLDSRKAGRFLEMVENSYTSHCSTDHYAFSLGLSLSSLNRLCKKQFGQSPKEVLSNRLIQEAKRRLTFTAESIEHVSDKLGFSDVTYFSRFFKRMVGNTPSQYRRQFRDLV